MIFVVVVLVVLLCSTSLALIFALQSINRLKRLCNFYYKRYTQAVDELSRVK